MTLQLKSILMLLTLIFASIGTTSSLAQKNSDAEKIQAKVNKYGVGKKVSVVNIYDEKFKGKITKIEKNSLTVKNNKTNKSETFSYDKVSKVKKKSFTKWIVIGSVAAAAVVFWAFATKACTNEGRNAVCL